GGAIDTESSSGLQEKNRPKPIHTKNKSLIWIFIGNVLRGARYELVDSGLLIIVQYTTFPRHQIWLFNAHQFQNRGGNITQYPVFYFFDVIVHQNKRHGVRSVRGIR